MKNHDNKQTDAIKPITKSCSTCLRTKQGTYGLICKALGTSVANDFWCKEHEAK